MEVRELPCAWAIMSRSLISIEHQSTIQLQANLPQPLPVERGMSPREAVTFARVRNAIDVPIKAVVAVTDDVEVLIARPGVGGSAGAGGSLEGSLIVMNG